MRSKLNLISATSIMVVLGLCGSAWTFSGAGSGTEAEQYIITTVQQLQEMQDDLDAWYVLGNDIDASDTQDWNGGEGFVPIGTFTGTLDGRGHTITGLYINRPTTNGIGLFRHTDNGAEIKNVGLVDVNVIGSMAVGALVNYNINSTLSNCWSSGTVKSMFIGGNSSGIGGLVGSNARGSLISKCYSTANVTGSAYQFGGLAGRNLYGAIIEDSYATGDVTGSSKVGGLVGDNTYNPGYPSTIIQRCYSVGKINGSGGGLVGYNYGGGQTYNSYWDIQTSGKTSSYGGAGRTTAEMMKQATFVGWDFDEIWDIDEGQSYPYFMEPRVLISLEIEGPNAVAENFSASYKAIAYYDNDSTRDVTNSALWAVEPNMAANIDENGVLRTKDIVTHQSVTMWASYTEGDVTVEAEKAINIFPICPTGTALQFDGVDDYVDCGSDSSLDVTELTWALWIKRGEGTYTNERALISNEGGGNNTRGTYALQIDVGGSNQDRIQFVRHGSDYVLSNTAIQDTYWHHIAVTRDSSNNVFIYIDGQEDGNGTVRERTAFTKTVIGSGHTYYSDFYGIIDEVRVYKRALSAEEIQANMHTRLAGDEPGLVGYWDFEEGEGQIAYDLSPYGNHGQLGSTPNPDDSDPAWVESDAPVGICTPVAIDIKPGSCPNPLNVRSKGVLPVAILGLEDFDVTTIDVASIRLAGIAPIRSSYEDVAAPLLDTQDECDCTTEGPDGYLDLTLKFATQEIVSTFDDVNNGDFLTLYLEGVSLDETPIEGGDCIVIVGKHKPFNKADINKDGVVNLADFAIITENWLESSIVEN